MFDREPLSLRRVLTVSFTTLVVASMIIYVLFQARHVIIGPQITLTTEHQTHTNERQVLLAGTTNNISRLWLNDRPIYTDPQGMFKEALVLENGYTVATLRAEDRYGRTTIVTREFVYTPATFIP